MTRSPLEYVLLNSRARDGKIANQRKLWLLPKTGFQPFNKNCILQSTAYDQNERI